MQRSRTGFLPSGWQPYSALFKKRQDHISEIWEFLASAMFSSQLADQRTGTFVMDILAEQLLAKVPA